MIGMRVVMLWLLVCGLVACGGEPAGDEAPTMPVEQTASGDDEAPWWASLPRAGWDPFERIEIDADQGWFEVYRVAPGTYALLEPGQWQEVICWLIEGEERAMLFDTGLGVGDVHTLALALTDLELFAMNSHTHFDHVGGNHQFARLYGTDHPFAVERTKGRTLAQGQEDVFTDGAVWMPLPEGFDKDRFRTRGWTVTDYVADGDVIDLGGRQLRVVYTPGHSPDSLSLLDADNRILFVGDTFYPAPLYAHLDGSSFVDYRASAERLAGFADAVDLVAPGHNEPVRGGAVLRRMHLAFEAVATGRDPDVASPGAEVHQFEDFSIIAPAGTQAAAAGASGAP